MHRTTDLIIHTGAVNASNCESLLASLPTLREAGIRQIQTASGLLSDPSQVPVAQLKAALVKHDIRVHSMHAAFSPEFDPSQLEESGRRKAVAGLATMIEITARLGGEMMVVHPGLPLGKEEDQAALLWASERSLREILPTAEKHRIALAIENLPPGYLGGNMEDVAGIIERIDSPMIGICLDTGHANLGGDPVADFLRCPDRVICFHLHDNDGSGDQHLPPGQGTVDWPRLIEAIKKHPRQRALVLEIVAQEEMSLQEILETSQAALRRLME